jgi:allantoin racemase
LRGLGLDPKLCRSARFIGTDPSTIVSKRHELRELYYQSGKKCIEEDGAEAIILNCAGVSDLKEYLEERLQVPIIAGTIAAVKIAEQMPICMKISVG